MRFFDKVTVKMVAAHARFSALVYFKNLKKILLVVTIYVKNYMNLYII